MKKFIGNGVTLTVTTGGSTAAATTVGGIMSIGGPDGDAADVDTMTLDSTTNDVTFERGFATSGDITMTIAYNQTDVGWLKLKAMRVSGKTGTFTAVHPSTSFTNEPHKAYVKGLGRAIERDTMITRTLTVHCSSGPGWI
jgi:hypothetical protein